MFSYRHAFHAGNHADVLKHMVLIATLKHLLQKDTPITVVDTHAGAGLYRLDDSFARTSGEADDGIAKLIAAPAGTLQPAVQDYLDMVASFNTPGSFKVYPGSPFIAQRLLRDTDKLKMFELHSTDSRALVSNVQELRAGRQVAVHIEDGFDGPKKFLPPPARRGLLLCDPSYEIKTDYAKVIAMLTDSLKRFATGTNVVWYPIIARREAQDLPRKLKLAATRAGKNWLHASLIVNAGAVNTTHGYDVESSDNQRPGLPGSGMFLINPPYTLYAALKTALPQLATLLGQDAHAISNLESGG
jgi:23S rRNA (adenine2030-N6)-methyltransferase